MELELGLKITHSRDDITSHSNLQLNKNYGGPLFLSRETDTAFFLIAHLKGFKKEHIDIKINEDGNRITISGTRAVQEMVLSGYIMQRKEVELRAFRKVFRIPDGVLLDKIKAKFSNEDSCLTIIMPKSEKGVCGLQIEEVEEESTTETEKPDEILEAANNEPEKQESEAREEDEEPEQEQEQEAMRNEMANEEQHEEAANDEDEQVEEQEQVKVERQKSLNKGDKTGTKLCPPLVVAGSAILVSLVVLVIGFIRAGSFSSNFFGWYATVLPAFTEIEYFNSQSNSQICLAVGITNGPTSIWLCPPETIHFQRIIFHALLKQCFYRQ